MGSAIAIPALAPLLDRLARRIQGAVQGWHGAADELIRALVMIAFLPHQAWLSVDAIVRAIYRRGISRRQSAGMADRRKARFDRRRGTSAARSRQMLDDRSGSPCC